MKFLAADLILNTPDPLTGQPTPDHEKLRRTVAWAEFAEQVGFDAVGIGERHTRPFLSSAPAVVLSHIAARTSRVRLLTTVAVLPLLDPLRVAEDYATVDHLSEGRVELVIGKGNDPHQNELFGYDLSDQWERNRENYELLRRLWTEESVTWSGRYRPDLVAATSLPRPYQESIRVWHGSASSTESTELAARWGDPLFSANGFHPLETYGRLVDHYRERYEHHGHGPGASALVGAGAGGLYVARTTQEAVETYRPFYEAFLQTPAAKHNKTPFTDLDDMLERGPALVGSPQQVLDKLHRYHEAFGHEVLSIGIDGVGVSEAQQKDSLELFFTEVAPVLRREVPSRVWNEGPAVTERSLTGSGRTADGEAANVALVGAGR